MNTTDTKHAQKTIIYTVGYLRYSIHMKYIQVKCVVGLPSIDALSERKVAVTGVPFIAQISLKKNKAFSRKNFPLAIHRNTSKNVFSFQQCRIFYRSKSFFTVAQSRKLTKYWMGSKDDKPASLFTVFLATREKKN